MILEVIGIPGRCTPAHQISGNYISMTFMRSYDKSIFTNSIKSLLGPAKHHADQVHAIDTIIGASLNSFMSSNAKDFVCKQSLSTHISEVRSELGRLKNVVQESRGRDFVQLKLVSDQLWRELRLLQNRSREQFSGIKLDTRRDLSDEKSHLKEVIANQLQKCYTFKHLVEQEATAGVLSSLVKMRSDVIYSTTGFFFTGTAAFLAYLRYLT